MSLKPDTTITTLSRSPLLDELTSSELAVLLRIVAATKTQGRRVRIANRQLHEVTRTAQRALVELERRKLVRVHVEADTSRTIEVM